MRKNCDPGDEAGAIDHATRHRYRWILWIALVFNTAMFFIEIVFGLVSRSVWPDAVIAELHKTT